MVHFLKKGCYPVVPQIICVECKFEGTPVWGAPIPKESSDVGSQMGS